MLTYSLDSNNEVNLNDSTSASNICFKISLLKKTQSLNTDFALKKLGFLHDLFKVMHNSSSSLVYYVSSKALKVDDKNDSYD